MANRPRASFNLFLSGEDLTFERTDLTPYYPVLQLLGYLPPGDIWVPQRQLTAAETSSDVREWFTPERWKLIKFRTLDRMSHKTPGLLGRFLSGETHVTFKITGIQVYYPALQLLGFEPPTENIAMPIDFVTASEHLLTWFTPERRSFVNSQGLDIAAGQPDGTLSQFLAGYPAGRRHLAKVGLSTYYPSLRMLGYAPNLDLSADESVQRHQVQSLEGEN
jgi:hypothetical protein